MGFTMRRAIERRTFSDVYAGESTGVKLGGSACPGVREITTVNKHNLSIAGPDIIRTDGRGQ
jgi:hypothetical protein